MCFPSLLFAATVLYINWRFVATLHWISLLAPLFPTAFAYFVFLCHILVILKMFKVFHHYYVCYGGNDLWCYYCVLRYHELHPYKTANLIDKYYICSNCSTDWLFCLFSSSPYPLRCNNIEIRPSNIMTSKCSSERKCHLSLTLSQRLDMIKLSEEACGKSR